MNPAARVAWRQAIRNELLIIISLLPSRLAPQRTRWHTHSTLATTLQVGNFGFALRKRFALGQRPGPPMSCSRASNDVRGNVLVTLD